jgi:hypothetical protein
MSYYQLISLKLQMGIDPDTSIDHASLIKMWKQHQLNPSTAEKQFIPQKRQTNATPHLRQVS